MITEEFEVARVSVGLIQPSYPCHLEYCNAVRLPAALHLNGGSFPGQYMPATEQLELSEFVELVVGNFADVSPVADGFSPAGSLSSDNYAATATSSECMPRHKAAEVPDHHDTDVACDEELRGRRHPAGDGEAASEGDGHGMRQLALLLECAVAISVDDLPDAHRMVLELTNAVSPYSPSPAERVVAYFANAMSSRVMNSCLGLFNPLISYKNVFADFHVFNNVVPFVKFAHFTANQTIIEAFHRRDSVHVVDLDAMQGLQWPALLHALATRPGGPPRVRFTALGAPAAALEETGRRLAGFARRLGVPLEFHAVGKKSGYMDPATIRPRRGETTAVNWVRHSLYDATGPEGGTMRLLEVIAPTVITVVEQEVAQGEGSFLDRFAGSLHYYSAVFDSVGASLSCDDPSRHRVENGVLAREVGNILAVGGPTRSGEERFGSWRAELARRGRFSQVAMSANAVAQAQLVINAFPLGHGYTLHQGDGTVGLGWKGTPLYTASAWSTPEAGGGSLPLVGGMFLR